MNKYNLLLLCNRPAKNADASAVMDHINAFVGFSKHNVCVLSFLGQLPKRIDLDRFDAVVIHYSLAIGYQIEHYIDSESKKRIKEYRGLKIVFVQDDYRAVNVVHDALNLMEIDVLYTVVPAREIKNVYPEAKLPGMRKVETFPGYVPKKLLDLEVLPIRERPIDIGYRSRKLPFWLGELAAEKWQIGNGVAERTKGCSLAIDISCEETKRIYGRDWIRFVSSCKVMLGVESGASVVDFSGELQRKVEAYQEQYPNVDFKEVQRKFLLGYDGKIIINTISPRCFEAAALRTAMLLYEGEYSGVLIPWRHYIPLKKDFSNFDEVLSVIKDPKRLQEIADCAYREIAQNDKYGYEAFVNGFDSIMEREIEERAKPRARNPYSRFNYLTHLLCSPVYVWRHVTAGVAQRLLLGTFLRRTVYGLWRRIPLNTRQTIRPFLRIIGR